MIRKLTKKVEIPADQLRGDRGLLPELTGEIHPELWGNVSGLWGDVSGLRGNVSGLRGDVSGLRGDVDECDITDADRDAGVGVSDLVVDTGTEPGKEK